MPQLSVVISEEIQQLLEEMAKATGITKSALAAEFVRKGCYEEASNQNKVAVFRERQKLVVGDRE